MVFAFFFVPALASANQNAKSLTTLIFFPVTAGSDWSKSSPRLSCFNLGVLPHEPEFNAG